MRQLHAVCTCVGRIWLTLIIAYCLRLRSLNPFLEPLDPLGFKPARAALAEVQMLGEIDMTAGRNPYGGKGARGFSDCRNYRRGRHERIMLAEDNQRWGLQSV